MFNLETAISEWRQQMLAVGVKAPVPLEELENHLREDVEQLVLHGRTEKDAFESAVAKIGKAPVVRDEFQKIEGGKKELGWKWKEGAIVAVTILFPVLVAGQVLLKKGHFSELTFAQEVSCLAAVTVFCVMAWGGRLGYKIFPVFRGARARIGAGILCVVPTVLWWSVFMNFIVPSHDFTIAQFLVAFLWGFIAPGGLMTGLVWGLETAARKSAATVQS